MSVLSRGRGGVGDKWALEAPGRWTMDVKEFSMIRTAWMRWLCIEENDGRLDDSGFEQLRIWCRFSFQCGMEK